MHNWHSTHPYASIELLIATKHQKEKVISPVLYDCFGIQCNSTSDFDTDVFGTFTGEIERKGSQLETCTLKAKMAAEKCHYQFALASEGSFGPHPYYHFLPGDIEMMCFYDKAHEIFLTESLISTNTNYDTLSLSKNQSYSDFLIKSQFPRHGLILRDASSKQVIQKGIQNHQLLDKMINRFFKDNPEHQLILETDMRAMMNPTRMEVIHLLAKKLANRLKKCCPACHFPGFGVKSYAGQLPCKWCGQQTNLYEHIIFSCQKCKHNDMRPREDGLLKADPGDCQYCNP